MVDRLGYYHMSRGNPHSNIRFYFPGICYDPSSSEDLDHGVLVIGYGSQGQESKNQKYWIVKNGYEKPRILILEIKRESCLESVLGDKSPALEHTCEIPEVFASRRESTGIFL